jgi:hypothetical protein
LYRDGELVAPCGYRSDEVDALVVRCRERDAAKAAAVEAQRAADNEAALVRAVAERADWAKLLTHMYPQLCAEGDADEINRELLLRDVMDLLSARVPYERYRELTHEDAPSPAELLSARALMKQLGVAIGCLCEGAGISGGYSIHIVAFGRTSAGVATVDFKAALGDHIVLRFREVIVPRD